MAANNQIVLIGRAGNNVSEDVKHLPSGAVVAEVRLAVNRTTKDAMGNPITDWIACQFWDKNGERLSEFVKKGDLISVSGALRVDNWEKNGEKRQKYFVHGENFQMLESKRSREERGDVSFASPVPTAPAPKPSSDFGEDSFAMDEDELPPF